MLSSWNLHSPRIRKVSHTRLQFKWKSLKSMTWLWLSLKRLSLIHLTLYHLTQVNLALKRLTLIRLTWVRLALKWCLNCSYTRLTNRYMCCRLESWTSLIAKYLRHGLCRLLNWYLRCTLHSFLWHRLDKYFRCTWN